MPATASSSDSQATIDSGSGMPGRNTPVDALAANLRHDLGFPGPEPDAVTQSREVHGQRRAPAARPDDRDVSHHV